MRKGYSAFGNPVFWLDIRSRLRERRLWMLALAMMAIPVAISLIFLAFTSNMRVDDFVETGTCLAAIAVFSHGALLLLLSALGAAQRISQERERRTLPALVNSPLPASRIATGKLLGAWLFTLWLSCTTLPLLAMASLWGGLSVPQLLACWALNTGAAFAAASLALGLSGLFGRSLSAYLASGTVLFLWCAVVPMVGVLCGGSFAGTEKLAEALYFSAFFHHLPLAPQVCIFSSFYSLRGAWAVVPFAVPLAAWTAVALAGRWLAVRGLKREIF